MNKHDNPFYRGHHHGYDTYILSVEDRLRAVKAFDLGQCRAALQVDSLQSTVRQAIERRIRKLSKGAA